jgi:hypothetical protein
MTSGTGPGEPSGERPVACTLSPSDMAALTSRWARLAGSADAERMQTKDGLRIAFRASREAERELAALVAVESDCCRWASWSVEQSDDRLVLVVTAGGAGVGALHGMFASLTEATSGSAG